jgi:hypothetical protein
MDFKTAKTYTALYHLAQQWFTENPGQQLELDAWQEEVNKANATTKKKQRIVQDGYYKVTNASGATIPVLAAISLGATSEALAAVIKHHGINLEQISDCIFEKIASPSLPAKPDVENHLSIDSWRVIREVVKAMSQDPDLRKIMALGATGHEDYPALDVARLLSSYENFWPVTSVHKSLAAKRAGLHGDKISQSYMTDVYSLFDKTVSYDDFTDAQVMTMLERSGHLCLGVNDENGFWCGSKQSLFNRMLLEAEGPNAKNIQRLIQAFNAVEDPIKISALTARFLEALPIHTHTYAQEYEGIKILGLVEKHLDQKKYAAVSNSMTVKINMIPSDLIRGDFSKLDDMAMPQCLEVFIHDGGTIFKRLQDELIKLEPTAYKFSHFAAINKVLENNNTPQDLAEIEMTRLMNTVFQALEAFSAQTHYSVSGSKTNAWVNDATECVSTLIKFASKQPDVDYSEFKDFPLGLKKLMAANGFDIKKLPGLNHRNKGHALDDGIGL